MIAIDTYSVAPEPGPIHQDFVQQFQPVGPLEEELVRQLAQVTTDLRTYEAARDTAVESGYSMLSNLSESMSRVTGGCVPGVSDEAECTLDARTVVPTDMVLISAIGSKPVRHCEDMITTKLREFRQLTKDLEKQQALRQTRNLPRLAQGARITIDGITVDSINVDSIDVDSIDVDSIKKVDGTTATRVAVAPAATQEAWHWLPAATEGDCEALFRAWRRTARLTCPQCGSPEPPLELTGRRVLQCRACEAQYGLRHGTIIATMKIPFRAFVHAVRLLAHEPTTPREALRQATGLCRRTLTKLTAVIREVLADPVRRNELLAACGWQQEQV